MRILCCYANLHPVTAISIAEFAPQAEMIDVIWDNFAYWREIATRWTGKEDLMTLEQDMEITEEIIPSFEECPEPWCLYEYQGPPNKGILRYSLGCTRFRKEFQQRFPRELFVPDDKQLDWIRVDVRISYVLVNMNGIEPHIHGRVNHLHEYGKPAPTFEEALNNSQIEQLQRGDLDVESLVSALAHLCHKVVYISDDLEGMEFLDNQVLNIEHLKLSGTLVPENEVKEE